jgi:hypothetical protein
MDENTNLTAREREALLARIHTGASRRRLRKALLTRGTPLLVLLLIAVPAAAALMGGDDHTKVAATDRDATTSTLMAASEPDSATTSTTGSTAVSGSSPTTVASSASPTTAAPTTTTTTRAETIQSCETADFEFRTTTDRPTYSAGAEVIATGTATNRSSKNCRIPIWRGAFVSDSRDTTIQSFDPPAGNSGPDDASRAVAPGQTITQSWRWDQRRCSSSGCVAAEPGDYTITFSWGGESPLTFARTSKFALTVA